MEYKPIDFEEAITGDQSRFNCALADSEDSANK
jgi:hypothetical protein